MTFIKWTWALFLIIIISSFGCTDDETIARPLGPDVNCDPDSITYRVSGQLTDECGDHLTLQQDLNIYVPLTDHSGFDTLHTVTSANGEISFLYSAIKHNCIPFHAYPPYLIQPEGDSTIYVFHSRIYDQYIEVKQGSSTAINININFEVADPLPVKEVLLQFYPHNSDYFRFYDFVIQGPISRDTTILFSPLNRLHYTINDKDIYKVMIQGSYHRYDDSGGAINATSTISDCTTDTLTMTVVITD